MEYLARVSTSLFPRAYLTSVHRWCRGWLPTCWGHHEPIVGYNLLALQLGGFGTYTFESSYLFCFDQQWCITDCSGLIPRHEEKLPRGSQQIKNWTGSIFQCWSDIFQCRSDIIFGMQFNVIEQRVCDNLHHRECLGSEYSSCRLTFHRPPWCLLWRHQIRESQAVPWTPSRWSLCLALWPCRRELSSGQIYNPLILLELVEVQLDVVNSVDGAKSFPFDHPQGLHKRHQSWVGP